MKHNLKTFPHRKQDKATEWVDANIRCPEYEKWFKAFEKELRNFANDGFKRRKWIEETFACHDEQTQADYAYVLKRHIEKELLGES